MYENFLLNKNAMKVLLWLYEHDGEYTAEAIQEDIKIDNFELVKFLHLLYTLGVCKVDTDKDTETLFVTPNKDSPLMASLNDIELFFDEKRNETHELEVVFGGTLDDFKSALNENMGLDMDEFLSMCNEDVDDSVVVTREDVVKFLAIYNNLFMSGE